MIPGRSSLPEAAFAKKFPDVAIDFQLKLGQSTARYSNELAASATHPL
jgi:hypothetical protein